MEISSIDIICLALITLIGLPHGAIDGPLLNRTNGMQAHHNIKLLAYIFAGISFWLFWVCFPNIGLLIFLIISLMHFGLGDLRSNFLSADLNRFEKFIISFCHGGLVTILVPVFHPEKTFLIFNLLGVTRDFFYSIFLIGFLFWCISFIVLSMNAFLFSLKRRPLYEIIFLAIICSLFDPIVFFTFYFCCIHTLRHLISIKDKCVSNKEFNGTIWKTIPFFFATMFIVASLVVYYGFFKDFDFTESLMKTVFLLLASLTVPHMLFIDGVFHKRQSSS